MRFEAMLWGGKLSSSLLICGLLAVGSFLLLALLYGYDLEYRYEVTAIVIDWVGLIVGGALLSLFLRRVG